MQQILSVWLLEGFWIIIVIALFLVTPDSFDLPQETVNVAAIVMIPFGWLFTVVNFIGIESDAIFENGVSNSRTSLMDTLSGRSFQSFSEISSIATLQSRTGMEGILLFAGAERKWRIGIFWDEHSNDFYGQLKQSLQVNCPSAEWVQLPFSPSLRRRRMGLKEARRPG
jgi:hypothetical protein